MARLFQKRHLGVIIAVMLIFGGIIILDGSFYLTYNKIDCTDNQVVDVSPTNAGHSESSYLEPIHPSNIQRLKQLTLLRGNNQDIARSDPAFSRDGKYLAVAGVSLSRDGSIVQPEACGNIWVWNLNSGKIKVLRIAEGRPSVIFSAFSPDSSLLLSNEYRNEDSTHIARVWEINDDISEVVGKSFRSGSTLRTPIQFNINKDLIAYKNEGGALRIRSLDENNDLDVFEGRDFNVTQFIFASDSSTLFFADQTGSIYLWSMDTRKKIRVFEGHHENITDLVLDPTGTWIASANLDNEEHGSVRIWNILTGLEKAVFNHPASELSFSSDGSELYSFTGDKRILVWNLETGDELVQTPLQSDREQTFYQAIFTPNSELIAAITHDAVLIWDTSTGEKLVTLGNTTQFMAIGISFSPDGKLLVIIGFDYSRSKISSSKDSVVQVWGVPTQR